MNNAFAHYATSQAFVLTLSRPMIDGLAWLAHKEGSMPVARLCWAIQHMALERRGLITAGIGPNGKTRLTKEGRLVLELCKCAGLVERDQQERVAA